MHKTILAVVAATTVVLGGAAAYASGPNCAMVKKDLGMGRTPEDIAERMMTTVDEVKKCQGDSANPGNSGNTPGAEHSGKKDDKSDQGKGND